MIIDIDKIVKEWSYRIDSGKPNPKNSVHLYHLSDILIEYRWPTQAIDELLNNIKNGVITLPNVVLNEGTQQEATLNTAMMETAALIGTTGVSR